MSKAAFARLQGVDRAQPTRWAQQGMPVLPGGLVDAVAAAAWLRENIDPGQRERRGRHAPEPPALTPTQQLTMLKVIEKREEMALTAGKRLDAAATADALSRLLIALRRGVLAMPGAIAIQAGLTPQQEKAAKAALADELRNFVAGLRAAGLPFTEPGDDDVG